MRIDEEGDNTLLYTTSYVAPGGQSAKAYPVFMVRKPILDEDLLAIKQGLDAVIGGRLRAAFPEGFNVDEKLRNVKFPTNGQTAFSEGSGTVIDIPENIQFLRSASYWKFGESRNIWFDNGWIFMEESGKFAGSCDWCTTHNTDFASFSGDPTIAGSPTNEACQLVDVRLNEVPGTVRYGLWSIRCYSDIPFSGAEDVLALLHWGEEPQKGSVLDPRRNVIKAPLTSDREPIVHLVMVDFHERKLIVVDQNFGGHVSGVSDMAGLVARRATSFARKAKRMPSMFDLLSLVPGSIPAVLSDEGLDIQGKALVINKRNDQNQIEDVRLAEVVDL